MFAKLEIIFQMFVLGIKKFLEWLERLIQLKPQDQARVYSKIGRKYADRGNIEDAVVSLKRAIELNPVDVEAYFKLGLVHNRKGLYNEAIDCFKKGYQIRPSEPNINYLLACMYSLVKMSEESIKHLRQGDGR